MICWTCCPIGARQSKYQTMQPNAFLTELPQCLRHSTIRFTGNHIMQCLKMYYMYSIQVPALGFTQNEMKTHNTMLPSFWVLGQVLQFEYLSCFLTTLISIEHDNILQD